MEYQKAIEILKKLPEKYPLDDEEQQAVTTAVGVLLLGSMAIKKLKAKKEKREKDSRWTE